MERFLRLLQIKTTRSAWVFLCGSAAMFLFTVYISFGGLTDWAMPSGFFLVVLAPWFLLTTAYMAIAVWALFSARGKAYIAIQEEKLTAVNRNILWYGKFLFACYAAALASMLLLGVLALPFSEYRVFEAMFGPNVGGYVLILGFLWAPLIFRYLK